MKPISHHQYLLERARRCREEAEQSPTALLRTTYLGFAAHFESSAATEVEFQALRSR